MKYTVRKGDNLSKIAERHFGDANLWKNIYDGNKGVIGKNPNRIKPGQVLDVPFSFRGLLSNLVHFHKTR